MNRTRKATITRLLFIVTESMILRSSYAGLSSANRTETRAQSRRNGNLEEKLKLTEVPGPASLAKYLNDLAREFYAAAPGKFSRPREMDNTFALIESCIYAHACNIIYMISRICTENTSLWTVKVNQWTLTPVGDVTLASLRGASGTVYLSPNGTLSLLRATTFFVSCITATCGSATS